MNDLELLKTCFLCQRNDEVKVNEIGGTDSPLMDIYRVECPRCGMYQITEDCYKFSGAKQLQDRYLLSGLVREMNEAKQPVRFTNENILKLMNGYPVPKPDDIEAKAKKFLERLRARTQYFGDTVRIFTAVDYPLAYAKNLGEFRALMNFLGERKWLTVTITANGYMVALTAEGWALVGTLGANNQSSQQGFVAAWFDSSMEDDIKVMCEAVEAAGYSPECILHEHFSEKIMDKALGEIRKSRFVVVNLTGNRNSVFFEAGFAHGLNIDVIYVYREDDANGLPPEFYVKHYQCYKYRDTDELKETLKNAIAARMK